MESSVSSVAASSDDGHPDMPVASSVGAPTPAPARATATATLRSAQLDDTRSEVAEENAKKVSEMRSTLALQERMIAALEEDNKRLVIDNRKLRDSVKQLKADGHGAKFDPTPDTSHQHVTSPTAPSPAPLRDVVDAAPARSAWHADEGEARAMVPKALMDRELEKLAVAHKAEAEDMARKVAWYVDHQEFNRAQEALVSEQQSTIHELRAKVMELESYVGGRAGSGAAAGQKDKQIRLLQRRVVELEEAQRSANPGSLTELIRASRPPVSEQRAYKLVEEKLAEAQRRLEEQDRHAQTTIDRLRVDSDALRAQYDAKLLRVEEELRRRLVETQTRKVKELEKALSDTRRMSSEKIKALEQANLALRRGVVPAGVVAAPSRPRSSSPSGRRGLPGRTADAEDEPGLNASRNTSVDGSELPPRAPAESIDYRRAPGAEVSSLERALVRVEGDNDRLRQQLASVQTELARVSQERVHPNADAASSLQAQVAHLEADVALHRRLLREAQENQRAAHAQWEDRMFQLRSNAQRDVEDVRRRHEVDVAQLREQHVQDLKRATASAGAGQHAAQLREALASSVADVSKRDARKYLLMVAERLDVIERREQARVAEHQVVIDEARRVAESEMAIERQRTGLELRRKNQEIASFQLQLDGLLAEVAALTPLRDPSQSYTTAPAVGNSPGRRG